MLKSTLFAVACFAAGAATGAQAGLTEQETRWLRAGAGVLEYARQLRLPIDVIVQPQATPGAVPLAMGFDGGRCKLVLSMRANPQAEQILEPLPPAQRDVMIEAMTAHEIGHCWRYAHGDWHALPAGFVDVGEEFINNPQLLSDTKELRDTRREEGFADLVALAWTQLHHPAQYRQVHAWLERVRHERPVAGGSHDTLAWLRLVEDGSAFAAAGTPFEQVRPLWRQGLIGDK